MNRVIGGLLLILGLQCGLTLAVFRPSLDSHRMPRESMAPLPLERVDVIHIGDEFDNETVLSRAGDHWILPELDNLPADGAMVSKLLEAIATGDGAWPVADSIAARQRFRVASYHYRRRIQLLEGDNILGTIFLGTSPGFRKIYSRNESQGDIYSIPFNAHDAPGDSGAWLDRQLLQVRAPLGIVADGYSLQREGDEWLSGIGRTPDKRELQALLDALRNLQIDGLASEDEQRGLAESEAELVLEVESLAGTVTLELLRRGDGNFIYSSEYPLYFTISAFDYDRLAGIDVGLISGETDLH
ncbi:MAG: DUF4340 domain-containing protein [Halioglobus sp.]|nr:DUF4340 domain-containing protein [Halioglobus sp.]